MRILFEVSGDVQLNRELLGVSERAGDVQPAFVAIAKLWISETAEQFATEGRHASGGWKPLKPETILAKRQRGLRPEILRASDALLQSLTKHGDSNMVLETAPDELAYGSRLPYAGAHQNPRPSSRLPQRRPVEFTERTRRQSVKILQRFLMTGSPA